MSHQTEDMDPGVLALGHPDAPSPPHPLGLELVDDVGNRGSPCPICPSPAFQPQHSPSPRTFPRLSAFLSTTTSCSFCWSSLLTPRLPTAGERNRSSGHLQPAGISLLQYPCQPPCRGIKNTLTRKFNGSPAVGFLGRVVHCQLRVVPAESVPGGTEGEPVGPHAAASPPMKELLLQGQVTTALPGVSVAKKEMHIRLNLFHFPLTGSVPLLTMSEQNSHLINKADLSRSESQRFFGGGNGILISYSERSLYR